MSNKNFFKLPTNEQRAVLEAAVQAADQEQEDRLVRNCNETQVLKYELVDLINEILDKDYVVRDKIVFTQHQNGDMDVTME